MNITDKFEHIYLLTMSNRPDRTNATKNQLAHFDIDFNNIDIHYGTVFPYNDIIINAFNKTGKGRFSKPNEYDCSRNHYAMIKEAYDRGFNNILIIEDDLQFLKDFSIWEHALNDIPDDYDIIQMGGFSGDPKIDKYMTSDKVKWVKHKDVGLWTTAMYALSRKGMKFYLAFMDKVFWVADGPLYKAPLNDKLVNTYMASLPLVIQADKNIVSSDIRTAETDDIDYNNQNRYEQFVSRSDYFDYQ